MIEEMKSASLGDVSTLITSGSRGWARYYAAEGFPFIRMTNLRRDGIALDLEDLRHVSLPENSVEAKRTKLKKGDILVSITAELGKIGFVRSVFDSDAFISQHVCLIRIESPEINNEYAAYLLASEPEHRRLNRLNDAGAKAGLNLQTIARYRLTFPPLPEQRKIAEILRTWDEAIAKLEAETTVKEKVHKGYVKRLVNDPQYKRRHVRDHLQPVSNRNSGQKTQRILSVTNSAGFVLAENQFAHRVASANLSNYKIVQRGQYAYNPARINVGSIARLDGWPDGALSPMYVVFQVKPSLDSDFFYHWLFSAEARQRIRLAAQGSVRETVSFDDLGSLPLPVPSLARQQAVARFLNESQREIELLRKSTEKHQRQKRGLMQKLLTGEWRVNR